MVNYQRASCQHAVIATIRVTFAELSPGQITSRYAKKGYSGNVTAMRDISFPKLVPNITPSRS